MATQLSQKRAFDPPAAIPDRLYFKIGDVAKICGVETYVLRFWETEFPQLKPNKSGAGQRLYRRRDVELVLEIRRLVHAEGYTLAGARQVLDQAKGRPGPQKVQQIPPQLAVVPDPLPVPQWEAQGDSQSRLPLLVAGSAQQRLDAAASAIGRARAELRELAAQLASPVPCVPRRRARLVTVPNPSESLFPA
jgi:DNA-binding transcriptional MerR regulator